MREPIPPKNMTFKGSEQPPHNRHHPAPSNIVHWVIAGVFLGAFIGGGFIRAFPSQAGDKILGDTCHIDRLILKKAIVQSYELLTQARPDIPRTLTVLEHAAYSTGTELP